MNQRFPKWLAAGVVAMALCQTAAAQEAMPFPAHAADLAEGEFWWLSGPHLGWGSGNGQSFAYDLRVGKKGGTWKTTSDGKTNAGSYAWDKPVYAPADGKVVRCWRKYPENRWPGDHVEPPNPALTRLGGGNELVIDYGGGRVGVYAHFKPNTIPQAICPDRPDQYITVSATDFHAAAEYPLAALPAVKKGDLLGHVGNSGGNNSQAPHLHNHLIAAYDYKNRSRPDSIPLRYRNVFVQRDLGASEALAAFWTPLRGAAVLDPQGSGDSQVALWPSGIHRFGDVVAAPASRVLAVASPMAQRTVVASRNAGGALILNAWRVTDQGAFTAAAAATAGEKTGLVAIASSPNLNGAFHTALLDDANQLKLVKWHLPPAAGSKLEKDYEISAGPVKGLSVATRNRAAGDGYVVAAAVITEEGTLKVIPYLDNGSAYVRKGDAGGPAGFNPGIAAGQAFPGFLAAQVAGSSIRVTAVKLAADGSLTVAGAASRAVPGGVMVVGGQNLQIVRMSSAGGSDLFAVAVHDSQSSALQVHAVSLNAAGQPTFVGQGTVTGLTLLGPSMTSPEPNTVAAAVLTGEKRMKVIGWRWLPASQSFERTVDETIGPLDDQPFLAALSPGSLAGLGADGILVGAVVDGAGKLKAIGWQTNLR
jgi:hypothetical protein